MHIIIFGQKVDPHVASVADLLGERDDIATTVLDQWAADQSAITIRQGGLKLVLADQQFEACAAPVLWWRVKSQFSETPQEFRDLYQERYWNAQWGSYQRGIELCLPQARSLNAHDVRHRISVKPFQIHLAIRAGFKVPESVFGNHAAQVSSLGEDVFFKHFTSHRVTEDLIAHTSRYSSEELAQNADLIPLCPGIFQAYVPKAHELRVCVFGQSIHAFEIDSQRFPTTRDDWRRMPLPAGCISETELADAETASVLEFMRLSQLDYGVFDFIRTPDGVLVFLEVNFDGQWKWLERATGVDMTKSVADMLIAAAHASATAPGLQAPGGR